MVAQLVKKPTFYGTRRIITVFFLDLILDHLNPIHTFLPYFSKICCNIILPSMPGFSKLSLPNKNFRLQFCMDFSSYAWYTPRLSYPP